MRVPCITAGTHKKGHSDKMPLREGDRTTALYTCLHKGGVSYVGQVPPTARATKNHPPARPWPTPTSHASGCWQPVLLTQQQHVPADLFHEAVAAGTATACTTLRLCWRCATLHRSDAVRRAQPSCCNCIAPQLTMQLTAAQTNWPQPASTCRHTP